MAVNPVEIEKYLKGVNYPANKQDLIKHAQQQGAPKEVLETLKQVREETYNKPTDVARAVGELK
jgi:hypothetical protein